MSRLRAWHSFVEQDLETSVQRAVSSLTAADIASSAWHPGTSGPGLLFHKRLDGCVTRFLHALRMEGVDRVLAIQLGADGAQPEEVWHLLDAGAADVLRWSAADPAVRGIRSRLERWYAIDEIIRSPLVADNLIGSSAPWIAALRQVIEAAMYTQAPILLAGESGTGKELAARLVHAVDRKSGKRDLVVVDCTTIVPELAGSEFFGHEKGAFTGAITARDGAFALADGGTLFLDEVGELSPAMQAQLLRVIEEGAVKRVGGSRWARTSFRLICATHRDLAADVARGTFRSDLYYRIASVTCSLPPLRDRPEDVLPLFRHFLEASLGHGVPEFDAQVTWLLMSRAYPGNVRDLRHVATRVAYRYVGGPLTVGTFAESDRPARDEPHRHWCDETFLGCLRSALARGVGLTEIKTVTSDAVVRLAMSATDGNVREAARSLGVTDRSLQLRRARWRRAVPGG